MANLSNYLTETRNNKESAHVEHRALKKKVGR